MGVNYDDKRFTDVKTQEKQALQNANNTYNNLINESEKFYQDLSNATENYAKTQSEIQQANTDFAIEQINQQKEQQQKDYTREQKGAYADWQRQSNQYGVNAEQLASSGLTRTGYSESSQVSMYNAYQNRVSQAKDSYNRAVVEYDNAIKDAQLQNNARLAEISYQALQTKLEYALNQFQYKSQMKQQQLAMQNEISNNYYNRWKDVLSQINTENALAEQKRQFDKEYALSVKSLNAKSGGGGGGGNTPSINPKGEPKIDDEISPENLAEIGAYVSGAVGGVANGIGNSVALSTKDRKTLANTKMNKTQEKYYNYLKTLSNSNAKKRLQNDYLNGGLSIDAVRIISARFGW